MTLVVKVHHKEDRTIVAAVDENLIGKLIEENGRQLDLRSDFYKGKIVALEEAGDLIRNADSVNLVGTEAVELGLKEGVIQKEHIITIGGVPYAQALLVHD